MGLQAIYPKKKTTIENKEHKKYPYLLRKININKPDVVWASDISYIRLKRGFVYLTVVMDWFSRYVISWKLSPSLESSFCNEVLLEALKTGKPEIFNTDQGCQYTSQEFTGILKKFEVKISMSGKGRCFDNIFVERLWRSVKYENIYLYAYETISEVQEGLEEYFEFYNEVRPHQSLKKKTPKEIYERGK